MKTVFIEAMGNSVRMRIYDFLIENDRTDWNENQIRKNAKIAYPTLKRELKILLGLGIIRKFNRGYKMDLNNVITKQLLGIYHTILINQKRAVSTGKLEGKS